MDERGKTARNIAIVLLLAVIVWRLPGGDAASRVIANLLTVILFGALLFFGYRMYMENRTTLLDLEERLRVMLYASTGLVVFTLVATGRMWDSGGAWILLWFGLIALAAYGLLTVFRTYREY